MLCFSAYWDDRQQTREGNGCGTGAFHYLKVHYYLASDEIMIAEVFERNSGLDKFPVFFKKQKLFFEAPLGAKGLGEGLV